MRLTLQAAMLSNPFAHDKGITLDFGVISGTDIVSSCRIGPVNVDETDSKKRETECVIPRSALKVASPPRLRIVMTVADR